MKYVKQTWLGYLLIGLIFQGPLIAETSPVHIPMKAQETVERMQTLLRDLEEIPGHLMREKAQRRKTDFEVTRFFEALPNLAMSEGYILDYVYAYGSLGGEPILYARKEKDPPLKTLDEYAKHFQLRVRWPHKNLSYLEKIVANDSQEGFFQLVVLRVMGNQFYQFWHCKYNDDVIVCSADALQALWRRLDSTGMEMFAIPDDVKKEAATADCTPRVYFYLDRIVAEVVIFSKWKGLVRRSYTIERRFPHHILAEKENILVPYNCGVLY